MITEADGIIRPGMGTAPAIALYDTKYPHNVGTVVRTASCYGFKQVWFSGKRVMLEVEKTGRLPREERMRGYKDVEIFHGDYFFNAFQGVTPVAIELTPGAEWLDEFVHPENALYVFGPEDGGLPPMVLGLCHRFVRIPTHHCLNLGMAVGTVLYDRHVKRVAQGLEERNELTEDRGFMEPDTMMEEVGVR